MAKKAGNASPGGSPGSGQSTLLGFDVGSSSIKAALLDTRTGALLASAASPRQELAIQADRPGWAEQDPAVWWENVVAAAAQIHAAAPEAWAGVAAIGVSYQMHGLVLLDAAGKLLRPSIIWCDSRAVEIGEKAYHGLGGSACLPRLLNSPGNFTASRLAWVRENEPALFSRAARFLLPGDWVVFRMTGEARTTVSGLSECILWDFQRNARADDVLDWFGIPPGIVPEPAATFSDQGRLGSEAASELALPKGTPVCYRAGDQPNNAFSLGVLDPGQAAATAGTSGVVYGIIDAPAWDAASRVNTFVHVNHAPGRARYGVLLCVSGTGILYSWLRRLLVGDSGSVPYEEMNRVSEQAPLGSDGLRFLPFGNGAERTLENANPGASLLGLDFNRHGIPHLLRAAQEGIVFALRYGLGIMQGMGLDIRTVRAGRSNMFLSPLFRRAFATTTGTRVELFETDGAQGAARGAGVGAGLYASPADAFVGLRAVHTEEPDAGTASAYRDAYGLWEESLKRSLR
jgi:xylulokinase